LSYLIEEVIPREYYTTMISLTADINVLLLLVMTHRPKLYKHFRGVNFELPMVMVELFITVFSTNATDITDIIFDLVLLEGSIVYFKTMLVFFSYYEKDLLELDDFCRIE
jgi:hypothetical protein